MYLYYTHTHSNMTASFNDQEYKILRNFFEEQMPGSKDSSKDSSKDICCQEYKILRSFFEEQMPGA